MKYIIIPLFRLATLLIIFLFLVFVMVFGFLWGLDSKPYTGWLSKDSGWLEFEDYYYENIFEYIINKKSQYEEEGESNG